MINRNTTSIIGVMLKPSLPDWTLFGTRINEPPWRAAAVEELTWRTSAATSSFEGRKDVLGHVGGFRHKLVDSIAEDGKGPQRRNGHDQPAHGGYQGLVDAFRQVAGAGRALRDRDTLEGKDHPRHGSQQPHHGRDVADHRQILDLAKQAGGLLCRRVLNRLFDRRPAAFDFRDTVQQHERQEAGLCPTGLIGFGHASRTQELTNLVPQSVRHDLFAAESSTDARSPGRRL